ncbi:MAG: O-antigen ligase family protein [Deltaproteobacteria bacterium]|nr:O-antigen ligase family protein [Deltaproteobacteria bacterium]
MEKIAFYLIALYIFTIPWEGVITIPGFGTVSRLIGITALFLSFFDIAITGKIKKLPLLFKFLILFVACVIISYFWTASEDLSQEKIITCLQLFVMTWLIYQYFDTPKKLEILMLAYIFGCYVACGSTFWDYAYKLSYYSTAERYAAAGSDPNEMAMIIAMGIPLAWYFSKTANQSKSLKRIIIFFLAVAAVAILLTGSRTGIICMLLALIMIPLSGQRIRFVTLLSMLVFVAIIGFIAAGLLPESIYERIADTGGEIRSGNFSDRGNIWQAVVSVFDDSNYIGVGAGALRVAIAKYYEKGVAHNTPLSVLSELGIQGFIAFVGVIILCIRGILHLKRDQRIMLISCGIIWLMGSMMLALEYTKITWFVYSLFAIFGTVGTVRNDAFPIRGASASVTVCNRADIREHKFL